MSLNHTKLKKDIEVSVRQKIMHIFSVHFLSFAGTFLQGMLDINSDGVLDSKDAAEAYAELNGILSYSMPTGSGFTGGVLLGIRG